jgi:hypothetical protein
MWWKEQFAIQWLRNSTEGGLDARVHRAQSSTGAICESVFESLPNEERFNITDLGECCQVSAITKT